MFSFFQNFNRVILYDDNTQDLVMYNTENLDENTVTLSKDDFGSLSSMFRKVFQCFLFTRSYLYTSLSCVELWHPVTILYNRVSQLHAAKSELSDNLDTGQSSCDWMC